MIDVRLACGGHEYDVTENNVIAALQPLIISLGLDAHLAEAIHSDPQPKLYLIDKQLGRVLGSLELQLTEHTALAGVRVGFFSILSGTHRCLRWLPRTWHELLQRRASKRTATAGAAAMTEDAVQQMLIFYICPRPVALVSLDDGEHSNLFPMDLIGRIAPDRFALALRNTSQSVATMKSARKLALSDVALDDCATVYRLGVHHKNVRVDWSALPFGIERSQEFSLPFPTIALRVREVEILEFRSIGSHTFFVSRVVSEQLRASGPRLFHTSGIHDHYRRRHPPSVRT